MNNKGFLFIEAIVTTVTLLTVLLVVYSGYNASVVEERNRLYYDDINYIYKAIDISEDIMNNYTLDSISCGSNITTDYKNLGVTSVFYIKNFYTLKDKINSKSVEDTTCNSFYDTIQSDSDFLKYLRTINPDSSVISKDNNKDGIIVIISKQSKSGTKGEECLSQDYKTCMGTSKKTMDCQCAVNYAWAYYYDKDGR